MAETRSAAAAASQASQSQLLEGIMTAIHELQVKQSASSAQIQDQVPTASLCFLNPTEDNSKNSNRALSSLNALSIVALSCEITVFTLNTWSIDGLRVACIGSTDGQTNAIEEAHQVGCSWYSFFSPHVCR